MIKTASIRAKSDHINGLIKQGASLYKNVLSPLNEKLAYRDLKDPLGPYEADRSAAVSGLDNQVAVDEYIREKHPVQYWLNPLVNGPISEIMHRLSRRHNASMGRSMGMEVGRGAAGLIGGINVPLAPGLGVHAGTDIFDIGATIAGGAGSKTRARDTFNTKLKPRLDMTKKRDEEDEAEKTSSDKDSDIGAYTATQLGQFRESDAAVAANEFNSSNRPFHYWLNPYVQGPLGEFKNRYLRRLAAARGTSTPAAVASSIPLLNLIGAPAAALLSGGLKNKNKMRRMSSPDIEDRKKKEVEKDVDVMTYGSNQNYARQRTKESMHVPRYLAFSYRLGKSAAEVGMPQVSPSGSTSSKLPISKVGRPRGLMSIKAPLAGGSQAGNNFFLTDNDPSVSVKKAGILYKKMDPTEPILTRLKKETIRPEKPK